MDTGEVTRIATLPEAVVDEPGFDCGSIIGGGASYIGQGPEVTGLRDYQQRLLEKAETALQTSEARVMLQLPTGGGKTHIAGALLRRWLRDGRKAVWLTHRTELAEQTRQMLADAGVSAINPAWRPGDDAPFISNGVVILMAQTVGRRTNRMQIWDKYDNADLLVIDEAHHATAEGWERAINQWPGQVMGLTATPWRLSKAEGYDHLFKKLLHGPQVSELQDGGWLCRARVLMPKPEEVIRGGAINAIGEYYESGIEQANRERPDVLTAGALRFWRFHAAERQTIIYAISQDHARNLTAVFKEAGIPAAEMLSDTPHQERTAAIESFGNGTLRVLVNVAVATEGFDLPDASCVVITRPTMSLALYLQMVGRGLRPKANGGGCLILDLAGNAETHGLPEENREWTLSPRGSEPSGDAPVIRCEKCDAVSPAASHRCGFCQMPFGKDCLRCGMWRAWERWHYENHCGEMHEPVCDLCHRDAHIKAHLPVTDELLRLTDMDTDLDAVLQNLLEEERQRAGSTEEEQKRELRSRISDRESELSNNDKLDAAFDQYITSLPSDERPGNLRQTSRLWHKWESGLNQELSDWKAELEKLEAKVPDRRVIYNNARERVLRALDDQAVQAGLLPRTTARRATPTQRTIAQNPNPAPVDLAGWVSLTDVVEWFEKKPNRSPPVKPQRIRNPKGNEISVSSWASLLRETADWLVQGGYLTSGECPVTVGNMNRRYLIDLHPTHPNGRTFTTKYARLSNGLYIELQWGPKSMAQRCYQLLAKFDQDPEQFQVLLQ